MFLNGTSMNTASQAHRLSRKKRFPKRVPVPYRTVIFALDSIAIKNRISSSDMRGRKNVFSQNSPFSVCVWYGNQFRAIGTFQFTFLEFFENKFSQKCSCLVPRKNSRKKSAKAKRREEKLKRGSPMIKPNEKRNKKRKKTHLNIRVISSPIRSPPSQVQCSKPPNN